MQPGNGGKGAKGEKGLGSVDDDGSHEDNEDDTKSLGEVGGVDLGGASSLEEHFLGDEWAIKKSRNSL